MPRVSIGTMAPADAALFADSGPATPSIAPFPNSSGCLETFFSTAYAKKEAMVEPAPGRTPTRKPRTVPRAIAQRLRAQSVEVSMTSRRPYRALRTRMSVTLSAPTSTSPIP